MWRTTSTSRHWSQTTTTFSLINVSGRSTYSSVHCRRQSVSCRSRSSVEQSSIARRLSPKTATIARNGDCRRIRRLYSRQCGQGFTFNTLTFSRGQCDFYMGLEKRRWDRPYRKGVFLPLGREGKSAPSRNFVNFHWVSNRLFWCILDELTTRRKFLCKNSAIFFLSLMGLSKLRALSCSLLRPAAARQGYIDHTVCHLFPVVTSWSF